MVQALASFIPSPHHLATRTRTAMGPSPELHWSCPATPFTGQPLSEVFLAEAQYSLFALTERALLAFITSLVQATDLSRERRWYYQAIRSMELRTLAARQDLGRYSPLAPTAWGLQRFTTFLVLTVSLTSFIPICHSQAVLFTGQRLCTAAVAMARYSVFRSHPS